ncbi:sensor histidine kinase [Marivivens sp. LCG002]|uniref:sensor histidine kinase n=1 Tax=Marivivens sp. LCG002 TaxID=3051171 RepID=UPI00255325CC|nr:sensor histidine kinase [Marivivens sp. LCG002]WIV50868.1 sensor histidine kinase [Marivivens sp. LCG002]
MKQLSEFFDGLAFRIAALLAVALFPLGLISVYQMFYVSEAIDRRSEVTLESLTAQAAANEIGLIRGGFGAASALAGVVQVVDPNDPMTCSVPFQVFVAENAQYSFAGFVSRDGVLRCASGGTGLDVSETESFVKQSQSPGLYTTITSNGRVSQTSVVIMSTAVFKEGEFIGYIAVSLPHSNIFEDINLLSDRPLELATFNAEGKIMSAQNGLATVWQRIPADIPLAELAQSQRIAFTATTLTGEERVFAVTPIVEDTIYAIGSWPREHFMVDDRWRWMSPLLIPALMWAASLGVAYLAVHRMVIRPVRRFKLEMKHFALSRQLPTYVPNPSMPFEIRRIGEVWRDLAETVLRDEAELEGTIHDKTVLLKEVHHRVKNNLQLISSIINMKMRKLSAPEARRALKDLQLRVMSIASVHRSLYEAEARGQVRADQLIRYIVQMSYENGLEKTSGVILDYEVEEVALYPDQALPLSLLAAEAATNAVKYLGKPTDSHARVLVQLKRLSGERAQFSLSNTTGVPLSDVQTEGSGLGTSLIEAFAAQIGGRVEVEETDTAYKITIEFSIQDFDLGQSKQPPSDY